jgi:hypothetical protein
MIVAAFIGYKRKIRCSVLLVMFVRFQISGHNTGVHFCGVLFFSYLGGYIVVVWGDFLCLGDEVFFVYCVIVYIISPFTFLIFFMTFYIAVFEGF